jgi:anhydro-N-acetylmuramic acid kinase
MIYIGVNTGTSADAVDAVAIQFVGNKSLFLAAYEWPFSDHLRQAIYQAVEDDTISHRACVMLGSKLAQVYQLAVEGVCEKAGITLSEVEAIGLHGQTIHHCPDHKPPYTLQLDQATDLAQRLGVRVVANFRAADIAQGGQGAPLIPAYHRFLAEQAGKSRAAFVNLGGIANITWFDGVANQLQGWDVGPANALLDAWAQSHLGQPFDDQGTWAQSGKVCPQLLQALLQDPYFAKKPPKSTGRDYFTEAWLRKGITQQSPQDVQATLVALTVQTIATALNQQGLGETFPVYLYGKGVANTYLCQQLQAQCPDFLLQTTEVLAMPPEWLEGGLFAWLAYCHDQRHAVDLRAVTGAKKPTILGALYPA